MCKTKKAENARQHADTSATTQSGVDLAADHDA